VTWNQEKSSVIKVTHKGERMKTPFTNDVFSTIWAAFEDANSRLKELNKELERIGKE